MQESRRSPPSGRLPGGPDGPVLLYDGLCGFCDRTVRWVLRADRRAVFRFAPLQGGFAGRVLAAHPELREVDSVVVVEPRGEGSAPTGTDPRISVRSTAFLRVAALLGGGWRVLGFLALIPRPLRDWAYDLFARHRHRLFGRYEACPVPAPEVRERFLD